MERMTSTRRGCGLLKWQGGTREGSNTLEVLEDTAHCWVLEKLMTTSNSPD